MVYQLVGAGEEVGDLRLCPRTQELILVSRANRF
jgi:hypothetical protein